MGIWQQVKKSIDDRILEDELLQRMELAMKEEPYQEDLAIRDAVAAGLPPPKFPKVQRPRPQALPPTGPPTHGAGPAVQSPVPSHPDVGPSPPQARANGTAGTAVGAAGPGSGSARSGHQGDSDKVSGTPPACGNGAGSPRAREAGAVLQHPVPSNMPLQLGDEAHPMGANGAVEGSHPHMRDSHPTGPTSAPPHRHQDSWAYPPGATQHADGSTANAGNGLEPHAQHGGVNAVNALQQGPGWVLQKGGGTAGGGPQGEPCMGEPGAPHRDKSEIEEMAERLLAERARERARAQLACQQEEEARAQLAQQQA